MIPPVYLRWYKNFNSYHISGPEPAEKRILAVAAFAKALAEVATNVDDDEDPLDSIKDYGKELLKAFTLNAIGEASKIARTAKKAWKAKKSKLKTQPSFKAWGKRVWQGGPPPAVAAPVAQPLTPVTTPSYPPRPLCATCGRTGHSEATCFSTHPELREVKP